MDVFFRYRQMVKHIDSIMIEDVNLAQIDDGIYAGEFGEFLTSVKLEVTVEDHQITNIEIVEQRASPNHEALEVLDRIIEAQSPNVDVVSGATGSSKSIMLAVQNALTGKED
jgi:uncharacterized protein with FMN-binding domain